MSPKKSFLERMGLIEPGSDDVASKSASNHTKTDVVPELETVPDLQAVFAKESGAASPQPPLQAQQKQVTAETVNFKEEGVIEKASAEAPAPSSGDVAFALDPRIGDKLDLIIGAYEKNKLRTIDEIYRDGKLESDTKKSIFITDIFLNALPNSLPLDVKRETVLNIIRISGIELDTLLDDAYRRIDALNAVLSETASASKEIYKRNENMILELEKRIQDLKEINSARRKFQDEQDTLVEFEIQKVAGMIEFIRPKGR